MNKIIDRFLPYTVYLVILVFLICYFWTVKDSYPNHDRQMDRSLRQKAQEENFPQISFQQSPRGLDIYRDSGYMDATDAYI